MIPLVIDTGKVLALDVAQRADDIAHALDEVTPILLPSSVFTLLLIKSGRRTQLISVEGLASYTDPQFWPKDASSLIGSLHIQLDPTTPQKDYDLDGIVERVDTLLRARIPGLEELTIQVEESGAGAGGASFRR